MLMTKIWPENQPKNFQAKNGFYVFLGGNFAEISLLILKILNLTISYFQNPP